MINLIIKSNENVKNSENRNELLSNKLLPAITATCRQTTFRKLSALIDFQNYEVGGASMCGPGCVPGCGPGVWSWMWYWGGVLGCGPGCGSLLSDW
ncbi:uncharacterized [Tachysurus ichikawai]